MLKACIYFDLMTQKRTRFTEPGSFFAPAYKTCRIIMRQVILYKIL